MNSVCASDQFDGVSYSVGSCVVVSLGGLFWLLCVVTTVLGLILGIFIHQRTWCAFCSIGTFASGVGGCKHPIMLDRKICIGCKKCEKICPFQLTILNNSENGIVRNQDCLKCLECVLVCPKNALSSKHR